LPLEEIIMEENLFEQPAGNPANRRSFLRNLSMIGAAVPAAMLSKTAHADAALSAAGNEPLRVAQAEPPKPKAVPAGAVENGDFKTLQDIVLAARRNLKPELWTHLTGGSESETTIRRNRMAYESLALRQRVLINVENVDISTTLLGQKLELPVFVCPVGGYTGQAHAQGIVAVVRGAEAAGTTAICASNVRPGFAAAAKAAKHPLIYQLYITSDRKWVADRLDRVKAAGYRALCVTVDRNFYSRRERDLIGGFERGGAGDDQSHQARLNWNDVVWMKDYIKLPLILKGIATAEDARLAVEHGADVVYISNHGGRQLDQGEGTLDVLPEVVNAVRGRAEVVLDGGVLRGTDVVKAISLGARAVGVGKLMGYALAAGGEAGVRRMLELMAIEVRTTMGLIGATSLKELNPTRVKRAMPVGLPTVTSAFPWFEEQLRK
jgi:isopentenyl diphosphate isomerase/L-lactate dehydrogenase-like FMN-dependent dehydrogenase